MFGVREQTCNIIADWNRTRDEKSATMRNQRNRVRVWCKPPDGWIKVNLDAACITCASQVGVDCVARYDCGRFLHAKTAVLQGQFQPREAEATGLREVLSWIMP